MTTSTRDNGTNQNQPRMPDRSIITQWLFNLESLTRSSANISKTIFYTTPFVLSCFAIGEYIKKGKESLLDRTLTRDIAVVHDTLYVPAPSPVQTNEALEKITHEQWNNVMNYMYVTDSITRDNRDAVVKTNEKIDWIVNYLQDPESPYNALMVSRKSVPFRNN